MFSRAGAWTLLVIAATSLAFLAGRWSAMCTSAASPAAESHAAANDVVARAIASEQELERLRGRLFQAERLLRVHHTTATTAPATDGPNEDGRACIARAQKLEAALSALRHGQSTSTPVPCHCPEQDRAVVNHAHQPLHAGAAVELLGSSFTGLVRVNHTAFVGQFLDYFPPLSAGKVSAYVLKRDGWNGENELRVQRAIDGEGNVALSAALSGCSHLDIVMSDPKEHKCLAVVEAQGVFNYHVTRYYREKQHAKQPIPQGQPVVGPEAHQFRPVGRLFMSGSYKGMYNRFPHKSQVELADKLMLGFLSAWDDLASKLDLVLSRATENPKFRKTVLVMCVNQGNLDFLFNFVCSAKDAEIDISNLVVFGASNDVVKAVQAMGFSAFYHPGLGKYPEASAKTFGDMNFARIMLLKILCVYAPIRLGYNVLFQDADLIWFRDPLPYFFQGKLYDTYWSDDAARSVRFQPFYANTGFYFLRANDKSVQLMRTVLSAYDRVLSWSTHQVMLDQILGDIHSQLGLSVKILPLDIWPNGALYQRKQFMADLRAGKIRPMFMHMAWTNNRVTKVKQFKNFTTETHQSGWYIKDGVDEDSIAAHLSDSLWLNSVCRPSSEVRWKAV